MSWREPKKGFPYHNKIFNTSPWSLVSKCVFSTCISDVTFRLFRKRFITVHFPLGVYALAIGSKTLWGSRTFTPVRGPFWRTKQDFASVWIGFEEHIARGQKELCGAEVWVRSMLSSLNMIESINTCGGHGLCINKWYVCLEMRQTLKSIILDRVNIHFDYYGMTFLNGPPRHTVVWFAFLSDFHAMYWWNQMFSFELNRESWKHFLLRAHCVNHNHCRLQDIFVSFSISESTTDQHTCRLKWDIQGA